MADKTSKLVLASASKGRLGLLKSIGVTPDVIAPADIDETPRTKELPKAFVRRLAREKARAIAPQHAGAVILAADTIAAVGGRIIGKAADAAEAREVLELFSGRRHRVYTGVCVIAPDGKERVRDVLTMVHFKRLETAEIDAYIASGEWEGKSGCYGLQTRGGGFVDSLNGSFSNVVGLPLVEAKRMLKAAGFRHPAV